jgi:hypothetical protein
MIRAGCFVLALAMAAMVLVHWQGARHEREDSDEICRAVIAFHRTDDQWMAGHAVLNKTSFVGMYGLDIPELASRVSLLKRPGFWWEFRSLVNSNQTVETLPFIPASPFPLPVVSTHKNTRILLTFSKPGFSFDHQRAVVFVNEECPNPWPLAPYFRGALIYLKKWDGRWIRDLDSGFPVVMVES